MLVNNCLYILMQVILYVSGGTHAVQALVPVLIGAVNNPHLSPNCRTNNHSIFGVQFCPSGGVRFVISIGGKCCRWSALLR